MKEAKVHIVRDGCELGIIGIEDARALLQDGFFQVSDEFWTDTDTVRRPLAELPPRNPARDKNLLGRTTSSLANIGSKVGSRAAGAVKSISAVTREKTSSVSNVTERVLEDYLPQLRRLVATKVQQTVGSAKAALSDDTFLRKLFGAVYDCLPKPVVRFVNEEAFIAFCMKHRSKLIESSTPTPATPE